MYGEFVTKGSNYKTLVQKDKVVTKGSNFWVFNLLKIIATVNGLKYLKKAYNCTNTNFKDEH